MPVTAPLRLHRMQCERITMRSMTVRGIPAELAVALDRERRRRGESLNRTVLDLLARSLGVGGAGPRSNGLARLAAGGPKRNTPQVPGGGCRVRPDRRGALALSRYCLDTSAYCHFRRGSPEVANRLDGAEWVGVPAVVLGELWTGFSWEAGSKRMPPALLSSWRMQTCTRSRSMARWHRSMPRSWSPSGAQAHPCPRTISGSRHAQPGRAPRCSPLTRTSARSGGQAPSFARPLPEADGNHGAPEGPAAPEGVARGERRPGSSRAAGDRAGISCDPAFPASRGRGGRRRARPRPDGRQWHRAPPTPGSRRQRWQGTRCSLLPGREDRGR